MKQQTEATKEKTKYPANLYLKDAVENSGQTVKHIAKTIGVSRKIVSDTIHGHYKWHKHYSSFKSTSKP